MDNQRKQVLKKPNDMANLGNLSYFCSHQAQMAESVDALVSNTSGATRAGSTPALGTKNPSTAPCRGVFLFLSPKFDHI